MKLTLAFLVVVTACTISAVPLVDDAPAAPYQRFIKFIDGEGIQQTIDLEEEIEDLEDDVSQYYLFTRENPEVGQELFSTADSIQNSNFNSKVNTIVTVHGWLGNQESGINSEIRDAVLGKEDVNVIVLDWRKLAIRNYVTAARWVPDVGRDLGRFVAFLSAQTGISLDSVHLVGFSLGAHLVGNAGKELEGKVARITALDPAGPGWNINSNKVSSDDAVYVEGIHTDGGLDISLGIGYSVGDVDFFPNGGNSQPGCVISSICSHNRAWRFFAASVTYDHLEGRGCSNTLQVSLNTCRGDRLNLGNTDLKKNGSGRFRVNTSRRYPY